MNSPKTKTLRQRMNLWELNIVKPNRELNKMYWKEERFCPHCLQPFYVRGIRLTDAKTLSCYHCGKRFKVKLPTQAPSKEGKA